jgi:hypothetical protein
LSERKRGVRKKQRCHKDMEVPGKHRVDEKTCWKDTKKHIRKDGELLKSSWGIFLESS